MSQEKKDLFDDFLYCNFPEEENVDNNLDLNESHVFNECPMCFKAYCFQQIMTEIAKGCVFDPTGEPRIVDENMLNKFRRGNSSNISDIIRNKCLIKRYINEYPNCQGTQINN